MGWTGGDGRGGGFSCFVFIQTDTQTHHLHTHHTHAPKAPYAWKGRRVAEYPRPSSSVVTPYMGESSCVTKISRGMIRTSLLPGGLYLMGCAGLVGGVVGLGWVETGGGH